MFQFVLYFVVRKVRNVSFNTCEISPRFETQWRNSISPKYRVREFSVETSIHFSLMPMSSETKLPRNIGDISGAQYTTFGELNSLALLLHNMVVSSIPLINGSDYYIS